MGFHSPRQSCATVVLAGGGAGRIWHSGMNLPERTRALTGLTAAGWIDRNRSVRQLHRTRPTARPGRWEAAGGSGRGLGAIHARSPPRGRTSSGNPGKNAETVRSSSIFLELHLPACVICNDAFVSAVWCLRRWALRNSRQRGRDACLEMGRGGDRFVWWACRLKEPGAFPATDLSPRPEQYLGRCGVRQRKVSDACA